MMFDAIAIVVTVICVGLGVRRVWLMENYINELRYWSPPVPAITFAEFQKYYRFGMHPGTSELRDAVYLERGYARTFFPGGFTWETGRLEP